MSGEPFSEAFSNYAEHLNVPQGIRQSFCDELYASIDDPRAAKLVSEKWINSMEPVNWPDGLRFLVDFQGKNGTQKQLCEVFAGSVFKLYRHKVNIIRWRRTVTSHPYLKIHRGQVLQPCPIHGDDEGLIFRIDGEYLTSKPFNESVFCCCTLIAPARREIMTQSIKPPL